jgi:hypothetical protein
MISGIETGSADGTHGDRPWRLQPLRPQSEPCRNLDAAQYQHLSHMAYVLCDLDWMKVC